MKEKWLYNFIANKTQKKVTVEKVKNENGEEVTKETPEEISIPHKFAILKPRRRQYEDAELFYGVKLAEGIKAGLLTKPQIAKRYNNDGGDLSENQKEFYGSLLIQKAKLLEEYQKLLIISENSESTKDRKKELSDTLMDIQSSISQFESERSTLFENTAESRATNQTVMWWIFNLSFYSDKENPSDDDFSPLFKGDTFDEKSDYYDDLFDAEDEFWLPNIRRITFLISLWNNNTISTKEDFAEIDKAYQDDMSKAKDSEEDEVEDSEEGLEEKIEDTQSELSGKKKRKIKQNES